MITQKGYIKALLIIFGAILSNKLLPKSSKNHQNGEKSPHLVTLNVGIQKNCFHTGGNGSETRENSVAKIVEQKLAIFQPKVAKPNS